MQEEWKRIEGYEDYEISNLGRVKLKSGINLGFKNKSGYLVVCLSLKENRKKRKKFLVHRLVASAFIENKNNLPIINHLDEDKTNNVYTNLEWTTIGENSRYSLKGRKKDMSYLTDEIRQKMSDSQKGRIPWNKGKTGIYSEETLKKIGEASKNRNVTDETRIKMSQFQKGRKKLNTANYKIAVKKRSRSKDGRFI